MLIAPSLLGELFEQAPHATFLLTPELVVMAVNAAGRRLLASDVVAEGKPLFALLPAPSIPNDPWQARLRQSYADLMASRKSVSLMLPARGGVDSSADAVAGERGVADLEEVPGTTAASIWHICHAPIIDASGNLIAIATHAHALSGVEIAVAQVSGFATTQRATAPGGAAGSASVAASAQEIASPAVAVATHAPDASAVPADTAIKELQILLVEDSEDLRLATVEQLQMLGHRVTGVADAEQAMRLLDAGRFDLLFTDLTLPKMTGAELARVVLSREQAMQVVITSGYGRALANAQSLDALFLPKPYRFEDLQDILQQVQARRLGVRN